MLEKIYRSWEDDDRKDIQKSKCQIGRPLSGIEDRRNWLRRPKLCIKSCTAIIIIITIIIIIIISQEDFKI